VRPLLAGSLLPRIPSWPIHADGPVSSQVTAPTVHQPKGRPFLPSRHASDTDGGARVPPTTPAYRIAIRCAIVIHGDP
jgi:hypothetical protein